VTTPAARTCQGCGTPLARKRYANGTLEPHARLATRRNCSPACAYATRRSSRRDRPGPAPAVPAGDDAFRRLLERETDASLRDDPATWLLRRSLDVAQRHLAGSS